MGATNGNSGFDFNCGDDCVTTGGGKAGGGITFTGDDTTITGGVGSFTGAGATTAAKFIKGALIFTATFATTAGTEEVGTVATIGEGAVMGVCAFTDSTRLIITGSGTDYKINVNKIKVK